MSGNGILPVPPVSSRLGAEPVDRIARNHDQRLRAVETSKLVTAKLIVGVELPDTELVVIAHGMGRPVVVFLSWPYRTFGTSGRISMQHENNPDPGSFIAMTAAGWSNTITVDVLVI